MRYSFAALALAALAVATPMPQGVTSAIAPSSTSSCSGSYDGTFEIEVVNATAASKLRKRTALVLTLSGGILKDADGRTGYIASNDQFQFDDPPQAGAIYTAGWSVCSNGTLELGAESVFYQCLSGTFYNLYDESTGAQCNPVYIQAVDGSSATAAASALTDGQVTASVVASQISDGQIQATTAVVTQISDGQIQATTATAAVVSQISDGQIQATTAAVVSQISDGQIQATTAAVVSQISDGQIQATTAAVVSQISDGQIQATTGANTTVAAATASVTAYTGGAMPTAIRGEFFGLAAGVLAVAML